MTKLLEVWVKAPFLRNASLLLAGECVGQVYPGLYEDFARGRIPLTVCPEAEGPGGIVAKLATILRVSNPRDLTVLTVEGSPHCLLLHASLCQALFLTGSDAKGRHYVALDGRALEVRPEAVRAARYLRIVDRLLAENPDALKELEELSLEQRSQGPRCRGSP